MAQRRIYDYGATLTQERVKSANSKLWPPLVYDGYDLTVGAPDTVAVAAGSLMLPNGVMVQENTAFSITLTFAGGAEDFTLVCTHQDEKILGGVGATYSAVSGFLTSYADSTILGRVRYPGAGALDASMIIQAPKGSFDAFGVTSQDLAPVRFLSPLQVVRAVSDPFWVSTQAAYSAVPVPHTREEIVFVGGPPAIETGTLYFSLLAKSTPPVQIRLRHTTPTTLGTSFQVDLYDTAGALVSSTVLTGAAGWQTTTIDLAPAGFTFTPGESFNLQLIASVPIAAVAETFLVEWVEVLFDPTP
jgi:hypothetical protein